MERRGFFSSGGNKFIPLFNILGEITFVWEGGLEWKSRLLVETE